MIYKILYIHPRWCRISSINSITGSGWLSIWHQSGVSKRKTCDPKSRIYLVASYTNQQVLGNLWDIPYVHQPALRYIWQWHIPKNPPSKAPIWETPPYITSLTKPILSKSLQFSLLLVVQRCTKYMVGSNLQRSCPENPAALLTSKGQFRWCSVHCFLQCWGFRSGDDTAHAVAREPQRE